MSRTDASLPQIGAAETSRRDAWWLQPTLVFVGLSIFVVYSTWAALQGGHYWVSDGGAQYLSPFYSPVVFTNENLAGVQGAAPAEHAWFGDWPTWWPTWLPATPALLILWGPGLFRFTCYYYRGAYYKAFWADPLNCAVGEPRGSYWGERSFPLILQNAHRYFLYIAFIFLCILTYDAAISYIWIAPDGSHEFGIGVGSIVLTLNVIYLAGYTFGCHSLRHLIGGRRDELGKAPLGKSCYDCVSAFNRRHMTWAWISLFWVGFADLYIRLVSMGVWTDWRPI